MMNIYQHFRDDEQAFIDQVIDWIVQVENQYFPYLTRFLNPRELFMIESVAGQYEQVKIKAFGGYEDAEQKRVLIYPPYYEPTEEDFKLSLIEINYPTKFAELSHGQIMGSILGSGLACDTLGDIVTDGERWQFVIDDAMKDYIFLNVDRVGRVNIHFEEQSFDDLVEINDNWEIREIVVSSLRIDTVLARALNFSRNRAKTMIQELKIKVNWSEIDRPDIELEPHDIISVRGFGRIKIREELSLTRKENIVLEIAIISSG